MKTISLPMLLGLALSALPCFAQDAQQIQRPPARAEDPAYTEDRRSSDSYTVDETQNPSVRQPDQAPAAIERGPASAYQPQNPPSDTESDQRLRSQRQQQSNNPSPTVNDNQSHPSYLNQIERNENARQQPAPAQRNPAAGEPLAPPSAPAPAASPRSEATRPSQEPVGSQLAFFEITPSLGSVSIKDKAAFTVGTDLSFHLANNTGLYFEPSLLVSFLSGDNNTPNVTLFHVDAGLRYDFVISGSPLIPFVKAAVGPTIASNSNTVVNGDKVSDSYVNVFAGGGLKLLINPHIGARFDAGISLQGTDTGLYALGAVALPL